jgi:hypothetical protein
MTDDSCATRRSKYPPLVVDGVDINESGHRMAEQALVEVETMKTSVKRLRALTRSLNIVVVAGAQLPSDLLDQITTEMDDLLDELSKRDAS